MKIFALYNQFFCHNVFLHWLHLYGCGSVAGGGRATIKELSDQSGVNCLARWSKYSAQDQDHNIQDQYTRPIYKTSIQDQYTRPRPRPRPWKNYETKVGSTAWPGGPNTLPKTKTTIYKTNIQDQYTRPVFKTNIQDQDQDQDHERTMRPKWGQLPDQVVQILCPRPRPQYTKPMYKTNIQDQYTRPGPRPRPWKNYQTKVESTAWPGPNTLPKTTIYTKILVTVQYK